MLEGWEWVGLRFLKWTPTEVETKYDDIALIASISANVNVHIALIDSAWPETRSLTITQLHF